MNVSVWMPAVRVLADTIPNTSGPLRGGSRSSSPASGAANRRSAMYMKTVQSLMRSTGIHVANSDGDRTMTPPLPRDAGGSTASREEAADTPARPSAREPHRQPAHREGTGADYPVPLISPRPPRGSTLPMAARSRSRQQVPRSRGHAAPPLAAARRYVRGAGPRRIGVRRHHDREDAARRLVQFR
jgi:hypothetical protein